DSAGFVYILQSSSSGYIKIGRTQGSPSGRLRSINTTPPYNTYAPWEVSEVRLVDDCRGLERDLHLRFRPYRVRGSAKELFGVPSEIARQELRQRGSAIEYEELFVDRGVKLYLYRLFETAGLFDVLEQKSWTLRLFPATGRGRWFT